MLTQWFDPEPAYRGAEFATDLVRRGYDVEVVTGFPNYPTGKIYKDYKLKHIQKTQEASGYSLTRLYLYPSHSGSKLGRILNYMSFFISSLLYLILFARKADLVYVYHPPASPAIAATLSKFFRRWPVVVEIQDLWPNTLKATKMISNDRVLLFVGGILRWMYLRVDHLIVQSWGFKAEIVSKGVHRDKITTILNWANEDTKPVLTHSVEFSADHKFKLLFAGNMGKAQDLVSVLKAAEILKRTNSDIGFYFLGDGVEADNLKKYARERNLNNVSFWERVDSSDVKPYLEGADALLVHLSDDPLFEITIPSKIPTYFLAGKPIILGVSGDAARLINASKSGYVVTPGHPNDLAKAVKKMASLSPSERKKMGERGHKYYANELSKDQGFKKYLEIFDKLISK